MQDSNTAARCGFFNVGHNNETPTLALAQITTKQDRWLALKWKECHGGQDLERCDASCIPVISYSPMSAVIFLSIVGGAGAVVDEMFYKLWVCWKA